jgi:hypothetical protein
VAAAALLAGCVTPVGAPVEVCDGSWREAESLVVTPGGTGERPVALDCIRQVDDRRIRIGFTLPGGPDCWRLSDFALVEGAHAVAVTLWIARSDDPTAGACAPDERRVATEIDLQAPVDDRRLLDGSAEAEHAGASPTGPGG